MTRSSVPTKLVANGPSWKSKAQICCGAREASEKPFEKDADSLSYACGPTN